MANSKTLASPRMKPVEGEEVTKGRRFLKELRSQKISRFRAKII